MRVRICKLNNLALGQQPLVGRYFIESIKHKNRSFSEQTVDVHGTRMAFGCAREFGDKEIAQGCCPSGEANM